jgi:hypothetical protein
VGQVDRQEFLEREIVGQPTNGVVQPDAFVRLESLERARGRFEAPRRAVGVEGAGRREVEPRGRRRIERDAFLRNERGRSAAFGGRFGRRGRRPRFALSAGPLRGAARDGDDGRGAQQRGDDARTEDPGPHTGSSATGAAA